MTRTTVNIDTPILQELRRLQRTERKSLGRLMSDLLSEALAAREQDTKAPDLTWTTQDMGALVDIRDKAALHAALDDEAS